MRMMRSVWQSSFVLLFTFNCASAGTNPNCPVGWYSDTTLNNNCYKPYATSKTWMDAEFQCRIDSDLKGHLASIHSAFEQNYLLGIAHDNGLSGCMWIGLQNLDHPGTNNYTWIDESRVDYTNWHPGHPPSAIYEYGVCMMIDSSEYIYQWWVDAIHYDQRQFMCLVSN